MPEFQRGHLKASKPHLFGVFFGLCDPSKGPLNPFSRWPRINTWSSCKCLGCHLEVVFPLLFVSLAYCCVASLYDMNGHMSRTTTDRGLVGFCMCLVLMELLKMVLNTKLGNLMLEQYPIFSFAKALPVGLGGLCVLLWQESQDEFLMRILNEN